MYLGIIYNYDSKFAVKLNKFHHKAMQRHEKDIVITRSQHNIILRHENIV